MSQKQPGAGIEVWYVPFICIFALGWQLAITSNMPGEMGQVYTDNHLYMVRLLETPWWESRGWLPQLNAPYGLILHWTFPFTAFMWLLAQPFRLFLEWREAAIWAGSLSSFAFYILTGLGCYRLGRQVMTSGWAMIGALFALSSLPVMLYGTIGRPDHHMPATAMVVWFWAFLAMIECGDRPLRSGFLAGLAAAMALWLTPETMPGLVLGLGLQTALRLLRDCDTAKTDLLATIVRLRTNLRADLLLGLGWIGLLLLALLIDPPYEGRWAVVHDRLSVLHPAFAAYTAILLVGRSLICRRLFQKGRVGLIRHMIAVGILGVIAVGAFLVNFPDAPAGAFNHLDPKIKGWIERISEMQPATSPAGITQTLGTPLIALFGLAWLIRRQRKQQPDLGGAPMLALFATTAVFLILLLAGMLHSRLAYYAGAASGPLIGLFLARAYAGAVPRWLGVEFVIPVLLGLPLLANAAVKQLPADENKSFYNLLNEHPNGQSACNAYPMVTFLPELETRLKQKWQSDKPMILMSGQNYSPAILFQTDFYSVAGPYHRNTEGLLDEAFFYGKASLEEAKAIIAKRGIAVVAVCIGALIEEPGIERGAIYDWAMKGGDDEFGDALLIPGQWVILARRDLLGSWAPIVREADVE